MIAKILVSPDLEERTKAINRILSEQNLQNPHPDLLYLVDEEKLGVEQAKKIREHLSLKPFQAKGRGVVLVSAQNLTLDAQNALLKTLEEPPEEAVILLGTDKEESLLPTILSRCQVIVLRSDAVGVKEEKQKNDNLLTSQPLTPNRYFIDIEHLTHCSIEERFLYIEKLEEKEAFLKALVAFYREKLPENLEFMKKLIQAEEWAEANGNIRGILEYLMLALPETPND